MIQRALFYPLPSLENPISSYFSSNFDSQLVSPHFPCYFTFSQLTSEVFERTKKLIFQKINFLAGPFPRFFAFSIDESRFSSMKWSRNKEQRACPPNLRRRFARINRELAGNCLQMRLTSVEFSSPSQPRTASTSEALQESTLTLCRLIQTGKSCLQLKICLISFFVFFSSSKIIFGQ